MHRILIFVLCSLNCGAFCGPIFKASGVQWSEPKGSGRGNITLIMIPQNNSADSDIIVAVKSDYQVLSQDTKLLNLIVNEKQCDNATTQKYDKRYNKLTNLKESNKPECVQNKIKYPNNARFFDSERKMLPLTMANHSINSLPNTHDKDKKYLNFKERSEESSTTNVLNFLNMINRGNENIYYKSSEDNLNDTNSLGSLIDIHKWFNSNHSMRESNSQNNIKLVEQYYSPTPPTIKSKDTFFNDALNILEKLNHTQSYYSNGVKSNLNMLNPTVERTFLDGNPKNLKGDDFALASDEAGLLEQECEQFGFNKNDKSNVEENSGVIPANLTSIPANCLPFLTTGYIQASPEQSLTLQGGTIIEQSTQESKNIINTTLTTYTETVTPLMEVDKSITTEQTASETLSTIFSTSKTNDIISQSQNDILVGSTSEIPVGGMQSASAQVYAIDEHVTAQSSTELCTTIVFMNNTSSSKGVFEQIFQMLTDASKNTEVTPSEFSPENNIGAGYSNLTIVQIESSTVFANFTKQEFDHSQSGKEMLPVPKKVTLEPRINCETLIKTNNTTTSDNIKINEPQLKEKDLIIPFVESSVFLANNNEMPRGKDVPIVLNSSLDKIILSDLQEKGDNIHGKAQLYNNNPMILNMKDEILPDTPSNPFEVKGFNKKKSYNKKTKLNKEKIFSPDINEILKMHFSGRNIILEQKPQYKSLLQNKQCEPISKNDTNSNSPHYKIQGDENGDQESQLNIPEKSSLSILSTTSQGKDSEDIHNKFNLENKSPTCQTITRFLSIPLDSIQQTNDNKSTSTMLSILGRTTVRGGISQGSEKSSISPPLEEDITSHTIYGTTPSYAKLDANKSSPSQNKTCKKVYIPANSLREIVIQIVRNTKRPKT